MNPWDARPGMTEVLLERLRYAAQARVSTEVVARAHHDWAADQLVVQLETELLAHRVGTQRGTVPVSGQIRTAEVPRHVLVELPRGWVRRLLRRPALTRWCPVVGDAVLTDAPDVLDVAGTATVRADLFHTFPRSTIRYPDHLGPAVMHVQQQPATGWTPEVRW